MRRRAWSASASPSSATGARSPTSPQDAYAGATNNTLGVAAGDQVQITVQDTGSALSARVTDITAGASTSSTANVGSHPPAYALVGVAPVIGSKKPVPVPNFNAVIFRQAMVGGAPLAHGRGLVKLARVAHRKVEISTSQLSQGGTSFTTTQQVP